MEAHRHYFFLSLSPDSTVVEALCSSSSTTTSQRACNDLIAISSVEILSCVWMYAEVLARAAAAVPATFGAAAIRVCLLRDFPEPHLRHQVRLDIV